MIKLSGRPDFLVFCCTFNQLLGHGFILNGPDGIRGKRKYTFFISRALLKFNAFGNISLKNLIAKYLDYSVHNIFGNIGSPVVQGNDYSDDFKVRIGDFFDLFNCLQKVISALQAKI